MIHVCLFLTSFASHLVLNKGPTVKLNGARSPPKYVSKYNCWIVCQQYMIWQQNYSSMEMAKSFVWVIKLLQTFLAMFSLSMLVAMGGLNQTLYLGMMRRVSYHSAAAKGKKHCCCLNFCLFLNFFHMIKIFFLDFETPFTHQGKFSKDVSLVVCDPSMNELSATLTGLCKYLYGSRSFTAHS